MNEEPERPDAAAESRPRAAVTIMVVTCVLLLATLFATPALSRARARAREKGCSNNLNFDVGLDLDATRVDVELDRDGARRGRQGAPKGCTDPRDPHRGHVVGNHADCRLVTCVDGHVQRVTHGADALNPATLAQTRAPGGFLGVLDDRCARE